MIAFRRFAPLLCAVLASVGYAFSISNLAGARTKKDVSPELLNTVPLAVQVLFAGGDRNLAANLSGFRVLVASTDRMDAADYKVQARLQKDIAWLNPAHQDNYYIAASLLPWAGEVEATQEILRRAADARHKDWMPLFYYGFGRYHFYKDPAGGAQALMEAVSHAIDEQDALTLRVLALKWTERGYSTGSAAGVVDAMAQTAPAGAFRKYLKKRATRLHDLAQLREAAKAYEQRYNKPLASLDDLKRTGILGQLPTDPFGVGYAVNATGMPMFAEQIQGSR